MAQGGLKYKLKLILFCSLIALHAKQKGGVNMAKRRDTHKALVPALDALIGDPDILMPGPDTKLKAEILYIPLQYIDRIREFRHEQSSRGEAATTLLGHFMRILEYVHYADGDSKTYVCKNGMKIEFVPPQDISDVSTNGRTGSNTHALATAKYAQKQLNDDGAVAILTGDNYMSSKALAQDIDVAHINPDVYTGRRRLSLPEELCDSWLRDHHITAEQFKEFFPDEKPLLLNEFVEFVIDPIVMSTYAINPHDFYKRIGRFEPGKDGEDPVLRRIHYIEDLPGCIQPRTVGQAMLAEALMAPVEEIPIVICPAVFGTGKTYLSVAIGYFLVTDKEKSQYDRIFVVPRDAELGKEIGFLPGDETQKTIAKSMPILDSLYNYFKNKGDKKKGNRDQTAGDIKKKVEIAIQDHFEFVSIINMGGRSISDCWIIYDESQDMERFQVNQLMKRIGEGSKMVITGDPHQVFNKHMNYHSNGLMYAATKMAGSPYAAVITMLEGEITRSEAAREIARRLDH